MKKLLYPISLFFMITLLASECGKEDPVILYPETGAFGPNLLQENEVNIISASRPTWNQNFYSLHAELPAEATLKVVIRNTSDDESAVWFYSSQDITGWDDISLYADNSQEFTAAGPATCNLQLSFMETGSAEIEIYENGKEESSRVKSISWD